MKPITAPRYRPIVAAVLLAVAALLLFSGASLAHAAFVRSEPGANSTLSKPPSAVIIWFTEPVEPGLGGISVLDAAGSTVSTGETTVLAGDPRALTLGLPHLPDGTYTVSWKSFSTVDGHSLSGSFAFSVGVPPAPGTAPPVSASSPLQSPIEVVLRWLQLLSILAIVGCLVFELVISQPVLDADDGSETMHSMDRRLESRTLILAWLAAGVFFAASAGELLVRTSLANDLPLFQALGRPMLPVLQTGWGNLWSWRMAILLSMVVVLLLESLERRKRRGSGRREWQMVALIFAAGALFTISLASHGAAAAEIRQAAIFSDYLHLLAASVWIGGVVYLALVVPPVMRSQRQQSSGEQPSTATGGLFCPENHAVAIGRFSTLATLSVGSLFITGLFNSWAQVAVFRALATPYGIALLAKLGLILPLLMLGAVNLLWVRPRLAHDERALQTLRSTVAAEAILAILVLLSVGVLVSMQPGRQAISQQEAGQPNKLVIQEEAEGANIKVVIEPGTLGPNLVTVSLTDRARRPITDATAVTVGLTYSDQDIAGSTQAAVQHGGGTWLVHGTAFSLEGNWQASVTVQRPGAFDARITFPFRVPLPAGGSPIVPSAQTGRTLWGVELLLLGLLFGGAGFYVGVRRTRTGLAAMACGGMAILAGVLMAIVSLVG